MLAKATRNQLFRKNHSKFTFTYSYNNLPRIHECCYNDNKITLDDEINKYSTYIQAFLQKRRILKYEIPAKISIMKIENQYNSQFNSQRDNTSFEELSLNTMTVMFDNTHFDSNYIKNVFLEKAEENIYKSIMGKVILNGYLNAELVLSHI
jgi:hypothetical protein